MDLYHIFLFTWKINFLRSLPYGPEREKCILESNQEIEDKSGSNYPESLRSLHALLREFLTVQVSRNNELTLSSLLAKNR